MDLKQIKGLGPKRIEALNAAGIYTASDLLWRFPVGYIDSTRDTPVAKALPGRFACFSLSFMGAPTLRYIKGMNMVTAQAEDDSGVIRIVWFNQPWARNQYKNGDQVVFYGRPEMVKGRLTLNNPKVIKERGIIPQYAPVGSRSGTVLSNLVGQLLPDLSGLCPETMPDRLIFLGTLALGSEDEARPYGEDPRRDMAGIFERFGRGQNSVRSSGSGLGLNIVQAIAETHGGRVWVNSEHGKGSTFYIDMPLSTGSKEA